MATYVFKWEKAYATGVLEGSSTVQITSGDIRMATSAAQLKIAEIHALSPNQVEIRDIQRIQFNTLGED
jgi:hypothetical protein